MIGCGLQQEGIGIAADDGTRLISTCGDVGRSHWWADDEQTVTGCAQNLNLTKSCFKPSSDPPFPTSTVRSLLLQSTFSQSELVTVNLEAVGTGRKSHGSYLDGSRQQTAGPRPLNPPPPPPAAASC